MVPTIFDVLARVDDLDVTPDIKQFLQFGFEFGVSFKTDEDFYDHIWQGFYLKKAGCNRLLNELVAEKILFFDGKAYWLADFAPSVEPNKPAKQARLSPAREGFVYLLHAKGTNRYKIGFTKNMTGRTASLKKQSPFPLEICHNYRVNDMRHEESLLHERYSAYRVHGEWFELPDKAVSEICGLEDCA